MWAYNFGAFVLGPIKLRRYAFFLLILLAALAQASVVRDPLELRALTEPQVVLDLLPPLIRQAEAANNPTRLAELYLAKANACRVIANWPCQRDAGESAVRAGNQSGAPLLAIRGLISQGRGNLALKDYTRANEQLAAAEAKLKNHPNAELSADVALGFSSLAFAIGKHASARDYAQSGLTRLGDEPAAGMRIRLLRNKARAEAQLGQLSEAQTTLDRALAVPGQLDDPKLTAEIFLETARVARLRNDQVAQREAARKVLDLAAKLKNSQLTGLGLEVLGLAALDAKDFPAAQENLSRAVESFRTLDLDRDELRVSRQLLALMSDPAELKRSLARVLELDRSIAETDRAQAADDFAARIEFAETQTQVARLEGENLLASERETSLKRSAELTRYVAILAALLVIGLAYWFWSQRKLNAQLSALLKARSVALMSTSHELRNPIAGVLGLSELLLRTHLSPQQREMIGAISNAGEAIGKLSQDLLDRGRIEEGRLKLKPRANSISATLKNIHLLHKPAAQQKGLRFLLNLDPTLPDQLLFDDHRLQQVLTNLLVNSIKFTAHGEIELSATRVEGGASDAAQIKFSVSDTGVGINSADISRIFEPFRKGRAGEHHRAGAGLGLAISNDLVRLMGAELKVQSESGGGTRMSFTVAFKRARTTDPAGPSKPRERAQTGIRILLVEDDPDVAMLLERQLEVLGNSTRVTHRADSARRAAFDEAFDLLLIDAELPDAKGPDLAPELRHLQRERNPNLRIAIVSGHDAPEQLPPGVDEWVSKPIGLERLTMLIATARR